MRELYGVIDIDPDELGTLKKYSLLLDALYLPVFGKPDDDIELAFRSTLDHESGMAADIDYLRGREFLKLVKADIDLLKTLISREITNKKITGVYPPDMHVIKEGAEVARKVSDWMVRICAGGVALTRKDIDVVALCYLPISSRPPGNPCRKADVLQVAMEQFPIPGDRSSWEDIFDFKQEMRDKQWTFRRFVSELATKKKTEAAIVDEFRYLLNDYTKEMDRYKLQRSISSWETYIIPTVEALESLKPSAVLKGLVAIKKRKLALMEGEAKQDGNPIAYVFEAQKEFGSPA